jgi:hypothetical protein
LVTSHFERPKNHIKPKKGQHKIASSNIMVQSKDKRIHEVPDRGSMTEANGVLPDETGSEASPAFDALSNSNGNDGIGESLEVVDPSSQ